MIAVFLYFGTFAKILKTGLVVRVPDSSPLVPRLATLLPALGLNAACVKFFAITSRPCHPRAMILCL